MARISKIRRDEIAANAQSTNTAYPDLAPALPLADSEHLITETERALFAACFGRLIEGILAEPD